jgi:hypothetical protein
MERVFLQKQETRITSAFCIFLGPCFRRSTLYKQQQYREQLINLDHLDSSQIGRGVCRETRLAIAAGLACDGETL